MDENKLLEKINKLEKEIKIQDRNLVKLTQALPKIIKNICTHVLLDKKILVQRPKKENKNE